MSVRLNKLLAQRGVGARRKCDELIKEGAVKVNGRVVLEPGSQIEPERDRVTVRDRPLPGASPLRYYVLNKPVGVITTLDDPEGRRTIREFLPPGARLFPVGRLDADTSGLLILTNDGELAHRLMHPRYGVMKVYRVRLDCAPGPGPLQRLQEGVEFEPGVRSAPARVRVLADEPGDAMIEVALHEGRYRQVRRMCEAVGLEVRALHRSAYGPLRLGPVQRGIWRELSDVEVSRLRAASARPSQRGQVGFLSPRSGSDATYRLARRLEKMAGEGSVAPRAGAARQPADRGRPHPPARPGRVAPRPVESQRPPRAEAALGEWKEAGRETQSGPVRRERPPRPDRLASRGPGRASARGPGRATPRGTGRAVFRGPGRPAFGESGRPVTRGPGRPTPRGAARFASRDSDRPRLRGPGRPASRGPGRPPSRGAGRPPSRGPGRPMSRGPGRPASRGPGRPASRGPGRPASRGPGRPASRGPGRPPSRGPGQNPRRAGRGSANARPPGRRERPRPR